MGIYRPVRAARRGISQKCVESPELVLSAACIPTFCELVALGMKRYVKRKSGGRRGRSRFARRSFAKKRFTRKRGRTNHVRNRKAILDLTSVKKQDTMVGLNLKQSSGEPVYAVTLDSTYNVMMWCPTFRGKGGRGATYPQVRSQDEVFWRGISDVFHIETGSSDPWLWRRVVFTKKGGWDGSVVDFTNYVTYVAEIGDVLPETGAVPTNPAVLHGNERYSRPLESMPVAQYEVVFGNMFQGTRTVDFQSWMTAKIDKTKIHVMSDRKRRIVSGNDSPVMRDYKQWIPLNKRMRYPTNESGSITNASSGFACDGTYGNLLDDVYVVDLFEQLSAAPSDIIISGQATAYWHEK